MTIRKNFIFDWSGTVSDDHFLNYQASMEVFKWYGAEPITYQQFTDAYQYPYMEFYQKFCPQAELEQTNKIFIPAIHQLGTPKLYPDALEVLTELKSRGSQLTVFSGIPQCKLDKELKAHGVSELFVEIKGSLYDKSHEIQSFLARNSFEPTNTFYVGDMVHDVETGKGAGVKTVAVSWGYDKPERLAQAEPDLMIFTLRDLLEL